MHFERKEPSNASVPSAAAFSVKVPAVCDDDARKIFGVFPAEVATQAKARGGTVVGGQSLTIHAISEQRLRMKSISHNDALPQCAHNCPALIGISFGWQPPQLFERKRHGTSN